MWPWAPARGKGRKICRTRGAAAEPVPALPCDRRVARGTPYGVGADSRPERRSALRKCPCTPCRSERRIPSARRVKRAARGAGAGERQTTNDIAAMVFSSAEYERRRVNELYEQLLDRPADSAGLAYFGNQLAHGVNDESIIAQIIASDEYFAISQE
jgi:hypothetical protein